jgi:ubiquinone/menaquinone biosynthesis C-methylase UbiE
MELESYREDEIQALIALIELSKPIETLNNNFYTFYPSSLKAAQTYFRDAAVDLTSAVKSLTHKGLICREKDTCLLTPEGKEAARAARSARPPIWYWYQEFYRAIQNSQAYSDYCQRVFGADLGQHGFSDMEQIELLSELLDIKAETSILDIGCGDGRIAEWLSDQTGAHVTGMDYIPLAIEGAQKRTAKKKDRLEFLVCHLDALEQLEDRFDLILSIDSIYFGKSIETTLQKMKNRMKPSGEMAVFCDEDLSDELDTLTLDHTQKDLSAAHHAHMQCKHKIAKSLEASFEAEGNRFIWENLMAESIDDPAPFDPVKHPPRYLYIIRRA